MCRNKIIRLICHVLLIVLWITLVNIFREENELYRDLLSNYSVRLHTGITTQQANTALRQLRSEDSNQVLWPTFWTETSETAIGDLRESQAQCIWYSGNIYSVYPVNYISGGNPSEVNFGGVAVSSSLAWEIWGSVDIIGKHISLNGLSANVTGVFSDNDSIVLVSCGNQELPLLWTAIEVEVPTSGANTFMASVLNLTDEYLHVEADSIVRRPYFRDITLVLSLIPLLLSLALVLVIMVKRLFRYKPTAAKIIIACVLICLLLLISGFFESLPDKFIPTRWSDFSHWGRLVDNYKYAIKEFMSVNPYSCDMMLKFHVLRQIANVCGQLFLMLMLIIASVRTFFWHTPARNIENEIMVSRIST